MALMPAPRSQYATTQEGRKCRKSTELTERIDAIDARISAAPVPLTEAQTVALATRAAEEVGRGIAERYGSATPNDPFNGIRNLGQAIIAASRGELPGNFLQLAAERALDDTV